MARISVLVLAIVGIYPFLSRIDYQDVVIEQEHYCSMVAARHWPDYRGTYYAECLPLAALNNIKPQANQ